MNETVTVNCKFHVTRRGRRTELREGEAKPCLNAPPKPVPRISRLMALAIRFERLICDGVVANLAELAALGHVTRARVTQIMNLLNLAPDIQEDLLFLQKPGSGRDGITEKSLRRIATNTNWSGQRQMWKRLCVQKSR